MEPIFKEQAILPHAKLTELSKFLFIHFIEYGYAPAAFANIWQKNQK
jgi:hypothetical protein